MNAPARQISSIQVQQSNSSSIASFTSEQINVLKNSIAKGATDEELELFLYACKRTGLDPFSRQIYSIKYGSSRTIQTSIDGFRSIASRNPDYAGQTTTLFCGKDGVWTEIWTSSDYPFAAKVGVYRKGFIEPTYAIAKWNSYAQYYSKNLSDMWKKFPELMLGKCAEALALRKAFPNDLSGLYTTDEMAQANNEVIEAQQVKEETQQKPELPSTKKWTEQNKKIADAQISESPTQEQKTIKVPAQVAQAQKVLDKKEKAIVAEVVDDEVVYNGCDAHKEKFKAFMKELASIKAMPKSNTEEIAAISTIYHIYNDRCMGVPLSFLKEHIQNLEKEFTFTHKKESSAA